MSHGSYAARVSSSDLSTTQSTFYAEVNLIAKAAMLYKNLILSQELVGEKNPEYITVPIYELENNTL